MNVVLCNSCIPANKNARKRRKSSLAAQADDASSTSHWRRLIQRAHLASTDEKKKSSLGKEEEEEENAPAPAAAAEAEASTDAEGASGSAANGPAGQIEYKSPSPDEEALMGACIANGFELLSNTQQRTEIRVRNNGGQTLTFEKLAVLEFSSARGRMSVVVRDADSKLRLYCKGSDSAVMPRIRAGDALSDVTQKHLDSMATNEGLRTLVFATRVLDQSEFDSWHSEYSQAAADINNPDKEKRVCVHLFHLLFFFLLFLLLIITLILLLIINIIILFLLLLLLLLLMVLLLLIFLSLLYFLLLSCFSFCCFFLFLLLYCVI